jgi:hypothetical protein
MGAARVGVDVMATPNPLKRPSRSFKSAISSLLFTTNIPLMCKGVDGDDGLMLDQSERCI